VDTCISSLTTAILNFWVISACITIVNDLLEFPQQKTIHTTLFIQPSNAYQGCFLRATIIIAYFRWISPIKVANMMSCLLKSRNAKVMKLMLSCREFICALIESFGQFVPIRFPCYCLNLAGYMLRWSGELGLKWRVICLATVVFVFIGLRAASGQFVSPRVAINLARDIGLGNDGLKCCSINPRTAGVVVKLRPPPFFLNNSGSRKNSRWAFTYSSGYSIRTLWWFAQRKIPSGYPVATSTTDVVRNNFI